MTNEMMDLSRERRESLRQGRLGRVAKVAVEPSCLGCTGLPPAQRDAGYRPEGSLSSNNVGGRLLRSLASLSMGSKCAPVRTPPLERARGMLLVKHRWLGIGDAITGTTAHKCAAQRNRYPGDTL